MIRKRLKQPTPVSFTTSVTNGSPDGTTRPTIEGKDARTGRFTKGNKLGRGNPYTYAQLRLQAAIREQLDDTALEKLVRAMIKHAMKGKGAYLIALLERFAGRVADWSVEERLARLEAAVEVKAVSSAPAR